jgi:hypothetical protein
MRLARVNQRALVVSLLIASLGSMPWAQAAPPRAQTSVAAVTSLAGAHLPASTVTAEWTRARDGRDSLTASGQNVPGATTIITAQWDSPLRTIGGDGTVVAFDHTYTYAGLPAQPPGGYDVTVSYRLPGTSTWHVVSSPRLPPYRGDIGPTAYEVSEHVRIWLGSLRHRRVYVRWQARITLPSPVVSYDDTVTVG